MRPIYATPRIENAERVAQILIEHEIPARVANTGRKIGRTRPRFSYFGSAENPAAWPQVIVVHADDRPRARAILRELGVMSPGTAPAVDLEGVQFASPATPQLRRRAVVGRVRRILLVAIGILAALIVIRMF